MMLSDALRPGFYSKKIILWRLTGGVTDVKRDNLILLLIENEAVYVEGKISVRRIKPIEAACCRLGGFFV